MVETIDEITVNFESDGKLLIKELCKEILTRGSWTTIMFLYQELDKKTEKYNPPKVSIRRYQKRGGAYKLQSKFVISNKKQGDLITKVLKEWYKNPEVAQGQEEDGEED